MHMPRWSHKRGAKGDQTAPDEGSADKLKQGSRFSPKTGESPMVTSLYRDFQCCSCSIRHKLYVWWSSISNVFFVCLFNVPIGYLVICYIAIENGPVEIVDLPIKNGGSFQFVMLIYQAGYLVGGDWFPWLDFMAAFPIFQVECIGSHGSPGSPFRTEVTVTFIEHWP